MPSSDNIRSIQSMSEWNTYLIDLKSPHLFLGRKAEGTLSTLFSNFSKMDKENREDSATTSSSIITVPEQIKKKNDDRSTQKLFDYLSTKHKDQDKKVNENITTVPCKGDGKHDKEGWMYCHKLTSKSYKWESTDTPGQKHVFRRRIWMRAAVWQPTSYLSRMLNGSIFSIFFGFYFVLLCFITFYLWCMCVCVCNVKDGGKTTSSNKVPAIESGEYFIMDLLSSLTMHVHLMSHESIVNILPRENAEEIEKQGFGKSDNSKPGKKHKYRKRGAYGSAKVKLKGARLLLSQTLAGMGRTVANTVMFVEKPQCIHERMQHLYFVNDMRMRAKRLEDLIKALQNLQFGASSHFHKLTDGSHVVCVYARACCILISY
ncbi:hypothetical protein RFI_07620 [Reticulomyxa filosa]|uniref:Uncharacterized protein n=1 Tax=Reticulomyxa filosa TaxID=46433 RepID=X6NUN6_RETFI|nr:hypothetical protein RFI_07620 [Reticulomyxa filosa]|eukprot:ETO29499.1 hypothetical protein RFI_07620 [Reticulomyxa filosa]